MLYMRRVDPEQNRFRWYLMRLQSCLFGGVDLVCCWGRIGQSGGAEKCLHFNSEQQAMKRADRLVRIRRRHGYEFVLSDGRIAGE